MKFDIPINCYVDIRLIFLRLPQSLKAFNKSQQRDCVDGQTKYKYMYYIYLIQILSCECVP